MALQIVEELMEEQANYYLSSRVSDDALYRQFPWLRERTRRDSILRASRTFLKKTHVPVAEKEECRKDATLRAAMELLKVLSRSESVPTVVRSELQKLEGQIESGEITEEGETGSAEFVDGSIILDLGTLLPELELAYDLAESNLPRRTLVIIDSIDGLSEKYGIQSNRIVNTLQKDLVDHSGTNVIYVLESAGKTQIDYLGDGVVILKSEERKGRRLRYLVIEKLRGSSIVRWRYLFTLADGRLKAFGETEIIRPESIRKHLPVEDPNEKRVSAGSSDIDRVIGGLPRGGLVLMEIGPDVPPDFIRVVDLLLVFDFLLKKRGVVWYPLQSVDCTALERQMRWGVPSDAISGCLRILTLAGDERCSFVSTIEGNDAANDFRWDSITYGLSAALNPFVALLGCDALEAQYGNDVMRQMHSFIERMRRHNNIVIAEATDKSASLSALAHQSQVHVQFENIDGTIVFSGIKPHTPYFAIEFEESERVPILRLLPII